MAFVDQLTVHIAAGDGGHGVVRWLHEKNKEYSGPAGGDGGAGGNVFVTAVRDVGILARYRTIKEFKAGRGEDGKSSSMHGKNGDDLIIQFPVGSLLTNKSTGEKFELLNEGETVMVCRGGRGGLGNEQFKSSINTRPTESTPGTKGERAEFFVELRLIADVGLIGLPNAGKSSLLNAITRANAKVGSYAFTTLEPNLGVLPGGLVLADIPGLIEGAAEGKGLGHAFLRHIERTKVLLHCISCEHADDLVATYQIVRSELAKYGGEILKKKEVILLTKSDLLTPDALSAAVQSVREFSHTVRTVSVYDDAALKDLVETLSPLASKSSL